MLTSKSNVYYEQTDGHSLAQDGTGNIYVYTQICTHLENKQDKSGV